MSSLSSRIALLEGMLLEQGVEPPPAVHPPKTRQEALERQEEDQNATRGSLERSREASQPRSGDRLAMTPPSSGDEDVEMRKPKQEDGAVSLADSAPLCLIEP